MGRTERDGSGRGTASWDQWFEAGHGEVEAIHIYSGVIDALKRACGDLRGKTVLELGCGRGQTLRAVAAEGAFGVGLDYSRPALAIARTTGDGRAKAAWVQADLAALPFKPATLDAIYSVGVMEHFRNTGSLIAAHAQALRPGGILLIQVPQTFNLYTVFKSVLIALGRWPYGGWETQFSKRQMAKLLRDSGLAVVECYGYGSFFLAGMRKLLGLKIDYDSHWRWTRETRFGRAFKALTAMEICIVGIRK
jgi:SAM-dependent methyltransferase